MIRNSKKRMLRRKIFNWIIRLKSKHINGLFDVDSFGYFTK